MTRSDPDPGNNALLGVGAAALMVICCAALPALLTGGVLAGTGSLLSNPWLIGAGAVLLVVAVIAIARRNRTSHTCCHPDRRGASEDLYHPPGHDTR